MRRAALISAAMISLVAAILLAGTVVFGADPRIETCTANVTDGTVLASFELPKAREFWNHFPNAGRAPELESDARAYVVAFSGPTDLVVAGAPPADGAGAADVGASVVTRVGVVCVVVNGTPTYYSGIDYAGFAP